MQNKIFLFLFLLKFLCIYFAKAAEGARIAGASRIIGVARNPDRFEEGTLSSDDLVYEKTIGFEFCV